jgi:copper chaperone CopZ
MNVRVLYFEGCPNHHGAVQLVHRVADESGVPVTIERVEVKDQADAERYRFLGSPTIQVGGVDVEPSARGRTDFAFACRMYGASGLPSADVVCAALLETTAGCCERTMPAQAGKVNTTVLAAVGSVGAALVASACCWLPPLLLLLGVSAAGVSSVFAGMRPWFLVGAFSLPGVGFYLSYYRTSACEPGSSCAPPNRRRMRFQRLMRWIALAGVLAFTFFPSYAGQASGDAAVVIPENASTMTRKVKGMDCEARAFTIRESLRQVPGVVEASVSYNSSKATVAYRDNLVPDEDAVVAAIHRAG